MLCGKTVYQDPSLMLSNTWEGNDNIWTRNEVVIRRCHGQTRKAPWSTIQDVEGGMTSMDDHEAT